jgi:hypothetical protein
MAKKIIRLDESKLKAIIMESVKRVLRETREDVCNKLIALQNRFGDIQQINLPDGVNLSSIESEDIKKVTSNPSPDAKYSVKLSSGMYVIINPEAPAIVRALQNQQERDILKQKHMDRLDAEMAAGNVRRVAELSPEEHKEAQKLLRQRDRIERGDPRAFKSMKQVQDYIMQKYDQDLEFYSKRTRRGREWVYEARITYVSASYADGPSYVPQKCVEDVTRFLEPFGFYYAGNREDNDERQWTSHGWHSWYRQGYDPDRALRRSMYDDFPEWMEADGY